MKGLKQDLRNRLALQVDEQLERLSSAIAKKDVTMEKEATEELELLRKTISLIDHGKVIFKERTVA